MRVRRPPVQSITKSRAVEIGARGAEISRDSLRAESLEYLRGGGTPLKSFPVLIAWYPSAVRPAVVDGRHRILLAREQGSATVPGRIIAYGPRGGIKWSYRGKVAV